MEKPFYKVRDFNNIRELMDNSKELFGERPAFEIKKGSELCEITYNEYYNEINAFVNALLDMNLGGKCIGICSDNRYEYVLTYIGTICSGSVIVPIDKELSYEDINGIIKASDTELLFCDKNILKKLDGNVPDGLILISLDDFEGYIDFSEFMARGIKLAESGKELWKSVEHDPEKLCTLLFTSGTTGASKGVMLCQRNYVFEIKAAMGVIKIKPEDCGISILPLHHTFESSIIVFFAPYCGAKITFCGGFKQALRNMKEYNPTVFVAVPLVLETIHKRLMKEISGRKNGELAFRIGSAVCKTAARVHIDLKKVFFKEIQENFGGKMRMIICGGASIDPQIIKDFDAFGIQVVYGYGLTECAPLAIINHDRLRTTDSIGKPLPGVETKIIERDANGIGELCVKGGMVMLGYYKNPEETAMVIDEDGFFHTGDLAYIDDKGNYHITGRCKNVIVTSNGKNIYPEELEYHFGTNNLVEECLVEGVENEKGETIVHAQVRPNIEEIKELLGHLPSPEELYSIVKDAVDKVNSKVPSFKKIKTFSVREKDFIKTSSQKIKRNYAHIQKDNGGNQQ